jgi:polyferredoxin
VFDVIAEFWPHVAVIQKRRFNDDHGYLSKVFLFAAIVTALGTLFETIVVMYIWGSAWHRWSLPFKIITPILHGIFSSAQVWGAYRFVGMWQYEKKKLKEKKQESQAP